MDDAYIEEPTERDEAYEDEDEDEDEDEEEDEEEEDEGEEEESPGKSILKEILIIVALALVMYFGLQLAVQSYTVEGVSMEPSFHTGHYVMANKIVYRFNSPSRGEVVIVKNPTNGEIVIKRIIGMPGETISFEEGEIYIDGMHLEEYPDFSLRSGDSGSQYIPDESDGGEDHYFLLGDNRNNSSDSRVWGSVPESDIVGKTSFRYWPLNTIGFLPGSNYEYSLEG
jgi:signal peptidase I